MLCFGKRIYIQGLIDCYFGRFSRTECQKPNKQKSLNIKMKHSTKNTLLFGIGELPPEATFSHSLLLQCKLWMCKKLHNFRTKIIFFLFMTSSHLVDCFVLVWVEMVSCGAWEFFPCFLSFHSVDHFICWFVERWIV